MDASDPSDPPTGAATSPPPSDPAPLRVLLVDDHEDTARVMGRLLQRLGYQVTTALSVASALEAFGREPADLIISDIRLPDGSGLDLMRRLRERGDPARPLRAIALSGFSLDEDVRKSKEAGFFEHLSKPINFQRLETVIRQVMAGPA